MDAHKQKGYHVYTFNVKEGETVTTMPVSSPTTTHRRPSHSAEDLTAGATICMRVTTTRAIFEQHMRHVHLARLSHVWPRAIIC
jgi:hypothetical protein